MYPVSEDYKSAIWSNSVQTSWGGLITTKGGEQIPITSDDIVLGAGRITRQTSMDNDIEIGTAYSSSLDIGIRTDVGRHTVYESQIEMWFELLLPSGDTRKVPCGTFYVTEPPDRNINNMTIHAYDAMFKFDKKLDVTLKGTPFSVLKYLCKLCEVELGVSETYIQSCPNGSAETEMYSDSAVTTYRDVLEHISGYLCCFSYIGVDNKLYLKRYGMNPDRVISPDNRYEYVPVDYVTYYTELTALYIPSNVEEAVSLRADGLIYRFGGNIFAQDSDTDARQGKLRAVLEGLSEIEYTPFTAKVPCDPSLMIGDVLTFTGNHAAEGNVSAITKQVIAIGGSMELECAGRDPVTETRSSSDKSYETLGDKIDSLTDAANRLFYDYNTYPVAIGTEEETIASITFYVSQNVDVEGHFLMNYTASESTRLILRFYDQFTEELFSPVEYDILAGTGAAEIPHAFLNRLPGIHVVYVTAQVYSGSLSVETRGALFTLDAGNYAEAVDDVTMDVRDIAVRQPMESNGIDQVWIVGVEKGRMVASKRAYSESYKSNPKWEGAYSVDDAVDAALEFDGSWVLRANNTQYTIETETQPWYFWIDSEGGLFAQKGDLESTKTQIDSGVTEVSACRGYSSEDYPEQDQGLVVAYVKSGKPYYAQYIYDAEVEVKRWLAPVLLADMEVEDVRVHRLNDYRLGFELTTDEANIWMYTARTYVAQAVRKEGCTVSLTDRTMFLYTHKDTDLSINYTHVISEDWKTLTIIASKEIRYFDDWRNLIGFDAQAIADSMIESLDIEAGDGVTVVTVVLNERPRKLITNVTMNPNNSNDAQAFIPDWGYVKVPQVALTFDTTVYRRFTMPTEEAGIQNSASGMAYHEIVQLRAWGKESAGIRNTAPNARYSHIDELRYSRDSESSEVEVTANGMAYSQVSPSPI